MAKRRRRKSTGEAKEAPATAAAAAIATPVACKLRFIPDSIDLGATAGETVKLFMHDHVGVVLVLKAEYGGKQLIPAGQAVAKFEFQVLPGSNTMKMVFVFSASTSGRGELREQCGQGSQFLRPLFGHEPLQLMRIVGAQT